jgi:hypothetical protein
MVLGLAGDGDFCWRLESGEAGVWTEREGILNEESSRGGWDGRSWILGRMDQALCWICFGFKASSSTFQGCLVLGLASHATLCHGPMAKFVQGQLNKIGAPLIVSRFYRVSTGAGDGDGSIPALILPSPLSSNRALLGLITGTS